MRFWKEVWADMQQGMTEQEAIDINIKRRQKTLLRKESTVVK